MLWSEKALRHPLDKAAEGCDETGRSQFFVYDRECTCVGLGVPTSSSSRGPCSVAVRAVRVGVATKRPWILMGMPLPAGRGTKHSCATTAEVKILHWGPSHVEITTPTDGTWYLTWYTYIATTTPVSTAPPPATTH